HTRSKRDWSSDVCSSDLIEDIFAILFENREICAALLGPHGDIGFLHRIEEMLSQYSLKALREAFPERMDDLKYTYAYCVAGGVGLIKDWLSHEIGRASCRERA